MKKIWILLVIVLVVLVAGFREGLEATATIKAPSMTNLAEPYPMNEMLALYDRIPQNIRNAYAQEIGVDATQARTQGASLIGNGTAMVYTMLYVRATTPLTESVIRSLLFEGPGPGPASRNLAVEAAKLYFVSPSPPPGATTTTATPPEAPHGPPPMPGTATPGAAGAEASRGISSGIANNQIWGPPFSGFGNLRNWGDGDGSGSGRYPIVLGPPREESPYMSGVGVVPGSQTPDLPPPGSTGSDPMAAFLPYSRQPGDKELIPDPYRVSQSYSPASNSSKNEPVPFLTDFSAFLK
jgi:hypothetical protein